MKKVYVVHGWSGSPQTDWFPWLKRELENRNFEVVVPTMPDTDTPEISAWVNKLQDIITEINSQTYLIAGSIGCQTIMRYAETLNNAAKFGGTLFVAPWFNLKMDNIVAEDGPEMIEIAQPWLITPIDTNKIKTILSPITALFSDDDPYVPLTDSQLFSQRLGANIIIKEKYSHFQGAAGHTELPIALDEFLKLANEK